MPAPSVPTPRERLRQLREKERLLREQHDEAKIVEADQRAKRISLGEQLDEVQHEIRRVRREIEASPVSEDLSLEVTDRALLQYLLEVKGFDLESVREEILDSIAESPEQIISLSTSAFRAGDRMMLVRDGKVVGILDSDLISGSKK